MENGEVMRAILKKERKSQRAYKQRREREKEGGKIHAQFYTHNAETDIVQMITHR